MWNNPHMLVLDEPTNYLDRESLGALAAGIADYGGAVVMISHNSGGLAACVGLAARVRLGLLRSAQRPQRTLRLPRHRLYLRSSLAHAPQRPAAELTPGL